MGIHQNNVGNLGLSQRLAASLIVEDEIGPLLRAERKAAGFSQQDVAIRLGLTVQAISQWETGTNEPTRQNLRAICSLFGCGSKQPSGGGCELGPIFDLQARLTHVSSLVQALGMAADSVSDPDVSEPFAAMAIVITSHLNQIAQRVDAMERGLA